MDQDIKVKRARFINDSVEVRDVFSFAQPEQILHAVRVFCGDWYGSMLWELDSEMCGQFCRTWNTCVKLVYEVPRSTHTYIVENLLAKKFLPVKTELMARGANFISSMSRSPSLEVRSMAIIARKDKRTVTAKNIETIKKESQLCDASLSANNVRNAVPVTKIPENQEWRISLLPKLLSHKKELEDNLEKTDAIDDMIESLCSS